MGVDALELAREVLEVEKKSTDATSIPTFWRQAAPILAREVINARTVENFAKETCERLRAQIADYEAALEDAAPYLPHREQKLVRAALEKWKTPERQRSEGHSL